MVIHRIFSTPVLTRIVPDAVNLNNRLREDMRSPINCSAGRGLWDAPGPAIAELACLFTEAAQEIVAPHAWEDFALARAWVTQGEAGPHLDVHNHGSTVLCGVYYLSAPQGSGNLLLIDPRGSVVWPVCDQHSGKSAYKQQPEEGLMVLFPGYLLHAVEPTRAGVGRRQSISTNMTGRIT